MVINMINYPITNITNARRIINIILPKNAVHLFLIVRILSSSTRIQAASFVPPQYSDDEKTVSRQPC